jgi:cytochrome o ubiquinol oxidase subunit 1
VFCAFVTILVFAFREQEEVEIPANQLAQFDRAHPTEVVL